MGVDIIVSKIDYNDWQFKLDKVTDKRLHMLRRAIQLNRFPTKHLDIQLRIEHLEGMRRKEMP